MITNLHLKNFKSHIDTDLRIAPLTILTGINGFGKTSVIQSILLLRQTYQKGRLNDGLDLNKPLCEIGNADDALYKLAKDGIIEFEIIEAEDTFSFQYDAGNHLQDSFLRRKEYSENVKDSRLNTMSLFNNHFQYISAARWGGRSSYLKDTYMVEVLRQLSSEKGQGELTGHFLDRYGGEPTYNYFENDGSEIPLLEQTIMWEQKISPGVRLNVQRSENNQGYNISYSFYTSKNTKSIDNLQAENVGFGISYTLPVIVALLSAVPGSLLIIENPEAHLHPQGQSQLARLFSLVAQRGVQIIVETHSDHFFNGVLVSCKKFEQGENGIDRNNVATYYMGKKNEFHATIEDEIIIEEQGKLRVQPYGFFDQEERDMYYLNSYEG